MWGAGLGQSWWTDRGFWKRNRSKGPCSLGQVLMAENALLESGILRVKCTAMCVRGLAQQAGEDGEPDKPGAGPPVHPVHARWRGTGVWFFLGRWGLQLYPPESRPGLAVPSGSGTPPARHPPEPSLACCPGGQGLWWHLRSFPVPMLSPAGQSTRDDAVMVVLRHSSWGDQVRFAD